MDVYFSYLFNVLCYFFFHLFFKSIKGNCFIYNVKFIGLNFPPNGPVMQKKTQGWEPNTERLYARDGMLIGNNFIACSSEIVVKSRSEKKDAKNARGMGRDIFPAATAPFPKSCASYFRFARFNTFPLYYLRAWHRLTTLWL